MANISRLAPYVYLAKRSGSTVYDLLLLVPVDANGDTDLSNVTPVKPSGSTRVTVSYMTNGNNAGTLYRFKHWAIDSEGTYLDIEVKGDNSADKSIVVKFADADTEPASVSNQMQTCAPYIFAKKETVGNDHFALPSCIVIFDSSLGVQSESVIFATDGCNPTYTMGTGTTNTDPTKFVVNQKVKSKLVLNVEFTFEATVEAYPALSKPPRGVKNRILVNQ
jgi:hypothetical protein